MSRSKKGGKTLRQRNALKRLEEAYASFKKAGQNKPARATTRNGRAIQHAEVPFDKECKRFEKDIELLKAKIKL